MNDNASFFCSFCLESLIVREDFNTAYFSPQSRSESGHDVSEPQTNILSFAPQTFLTKPCLLNRPLAHGRLCEFYIPSLATRFVAMTRCRGPQKDSKADAIGTSRHTFNSTNSIPLDVWSPVLQRWFVCLPLVSFVCI